MYSLTGLQRDVLYVVAGLEEPHGLASKAGLDTYYPPEIYQGGLYPNLDTLVEEGLVGKASHNDRTNAHTVTERGKLVIADRRAWEQRCVEPVGYDRRRASRLGLGGSQVLRGNRYPTVAVIVVVVPDTDTARVATSCQVGAVSVRYGPVVGREDFRP